MGLGIQTVWCPDLACTPFMSVNLEGEASFHLQVTRLSLIEVRPLPSSLTDCHQEHFKSADSLYLGSDQSKAALRPSSMIILLLTAGDNGMKSSASAQWLQMTSEPYSLAIVHRLLPDDGTSLEYIYERCPPRIEHLVFLSQHHPGPINNHVPRAMANTRSSTCSLQFGHSRLGSATFNLQFSASDSP